MMKILTISVILALFIACNSDNGTDLYSFKMGSGDPIIVVHGGPGLSHDYLKYHLEPLSDDYSLIFYDQRGCGKSYDPSDTTSITMEQFMKDVDDIRSTHGYEKVTILAHSWGGLLGLKYAIEYSDRLSGLILVNSVSASSAQGAKANTLLAQRLTSEDNQKRLEIMQSDEFKNREVSTIETLMKIGFKHQFYDTEKLDQLELHLPEHFFETSTILQSMSSELAAYDYSNDIQGISCPVLLIYGDFDPLTTVAAPEYDRLIPDSRLAVFPECGHFPFIEKKEEFYSAVRDFLSDLH